MVQLPFTHSIAPLTPPTHSPITYVTYRIANFMESFQIAAFCFLPKLSTCKTCAKLRKSSPRWFPQERRPSNTLLAVTSRENISRIKGALDKQFNFDL